MGTDELKNWKSFGGDVGRYCRFCEERNPGCHDNCEKYQQAKRDHDEYVKTVMHNRSKDNLIYHHKIASIRREEKKRR